MVHTEQAGVLYECRICGTIVDVMDECCPECGSTEIAEYPMWALNHRQ